MQIASKRYPRTHGERKKNVGDKVRAKRRNLPTSYDNAGKRGDQRSWKEQRKNQFREEITMTREEVTEAVIQELLALGMAKPGLRMAKHGVTKQAKKIKHNVGIMTGKAKAGSHWSQSK